MDAMLQESLDEEVRLREIVGELDMDGEKREMDRQKILVGGKIEALKTGELEGRLKETEYGNTKWHSVEDIIEEGSRIFDTLLAQIESSDNYCLALRAKFDESSLEKKTQLSGKREEFSRLTTQLGHAQHKGIHIKKVESLKHMYSANEQIIVTANHRRSEKNAQKDANSTKLMEVMSKIEQNKSRVDSHDTALHWQLSLNLKKDRDALKTKIDSL